MSDDARETSEETRSLSEAALEALAHDRRELLSDEDRALLAALDASEDEAHDALFAALARDREESDVLGVALKRALPDVPDVDGLVMRAMRLAPEEGAPTRRSLWGAGAIGLGIAIAAGLVGVLSSGGPVGAGTAALHSMGAVARVARTLGGALDHSVSLLPGGWSSVALAGLVLASAIGLALRALDARRVRPLWPTASMMVLGLALPLGGVGPSRALAWEIEGEWPASDPVVSVDVERVQRSAALDQALRSADLGLVYSLPEDPQVTLHVRAAPLREVLDALLGDAPARVRHSGHLVVIREGGSATATATTTSETATPEAATAAEAPPFAGNEPRTLLVEAPLPPVAVPALPPLPPMPPLQVPPMQAPPVLDTVPRPRHAQLDDMVTMGGNAHVRADQEVRDVVTMGGDARIDGHAFGSVVTMGGDADVRGVVVGDVVTMGGDIHVRDGGRVHGELNAMGGEIAVDDPSGAGSASALALATSSGGPIAWDEPEHDWLGDLAGSLMRWALLFVMVLVFMGLAPDRVRALEEQIRKEPVRNLLLGVLGALGGGLLAVVLAITLIGIPASLVLGLLLFFGTFTGLGTAAHVVGKSLPIDALRDRPLRQLVAGVVLLFLVSLVPAIGGLITAIAAMIGLGAVIATRFGGRIA